MRKYWELAAAIEANSNHILGQAIVSYASKKSKLTPAKKVSEVAGKGLTGRVKHHEVHVGRASFLEDAGVNIPAGAIASQTATYVAIDGKLAGVITFVDNVRPESKGLLKHLRKLGIKHTLMVTGDNQKTAGVVAKQLGIEKW